MQKLIPFLSICLFILGCNSNTRVDGLPIEKESTIEGTKVVEGKIDTLPVVKTYSVIQETDCTCVFTKYGNIRSVDISFSNSEYDIAQNDSIFSRWSSDSLVNTVKSIRFVRFDTIPRKYAVFKNVEKISIDELRTGNAIYGLSMFPKLKAIYFFGAKVDLSSNNKWLSNIEVFVAEKTSFTGLGSFSKIPNLTKMHLSFSGFNTFPKDFDKLTCINELTLGAYGYGKVDLNTIDISKNRCLHKIEALAWGGVFTGIPKGLKDSNIKDVKINHPQLTELEKAELKAIKASL